MASAVLALTSTEGSRRSNVSATQEGIVENLMKISII